MSGVENFGLFINGEWVLAENSMEVINKYTGQSFATIGMTTEKHVKSAVETAKAAQLKEFNAPNRYEVLMRVANLLTKNREEFATTITKEVGKALSESYGEVDRSVQTLIISAEEAKRIHGEVVPVESAEGSENRIAFSLKVPVGVIAAITPFNVPLNLVCHKIGPAIASGNSVILKPAEKTSIVALLLTKLFEEAGLPKGRLNVLTGDGKQIGDWLLDNQDVNMFTFTGSKRVGEYLKSKAGIRKVTLELGNNSATIVHKDADIEEAASLVAARGYNNAGQVCISVQRVYVHEEINTEFLALLKEKVEALKLGDPFDKETEVGPMISEVEAKRVEEWVNAAVEQGAELITGGVREGVFYRPTILNKVEPQMKVSCEEVFGPVVSVMAYENIDEAIEKVNDSEYGLQAGIFTNDLKVAMGAAKKIEVGGLIINDTSGYRVDQMPYGGVKNSGTGKEGPLYAIKEMTDERLIVMNL